MQDDSEFDDIITTKEFWQSVGLGSHEARKRGKKDAVLEAYVNEDIRELVQIAYNEKVVRIAKHPEKGALTVVFHYEKSGNKLKRVICAARQATEEEKFVLESFIAVYKRKNLSYRKG